MKNRLVARRYAKALLMNIDTEHIASFQQDIQRLDQIFAANPDQVKSVNSPLYPLQSRLDLTAEISKKLHNSQIWENLFEILIHKHRFDIICEILLELEAAIMAQNNQIKVQLTVAHEHPEKVTADIKQTIQDILQKDLKLQIKFDPTIIGGFVAQTDSLLIDGSIRNNLAKLTKIKMKVMRTV